MAWIDVGTDENGVTDGEVRLQYAQSTSNVAGITLRAGSYVIATFKSNLAT